MKKNLIFLLLLTWGITSLHAQQTFEIRLSEEHPEQTERLDIRGRDNESNANGNVTVRLSNITNHNASMSVTIENTDESNLFILFSRSWTKKDLRKSHIIDKRFNNSNTEIEKCEGIQKDLFLSPSNDVVLTSLDVVRGEEIVYHIPFYIAKRKKTFLNLCNKTILQSKCVLDLKVIVEEKADKELLKLQENLNAFYEDYQKAINEHVFCVNPSHRPSLAERVNPYIIHKDNLRRRIDNARNQWETYSKQYERYQELVDKIEAIRLDEDFLVDSIKDDCGEHIHKCTYCKYSLDVLRKKIEDYYVNVQKGKETKEKVWSEVKKIHVCSKQPKRKKEKQAEELREIIETYYKLLDPNNKR